MRIKNNFKISKGLIYLMLWMWVVFQVFPMFYMVLSSLKTDPEIMTNPFSLPASLYVQNYIDVWGSKETSLGVYFSNSVFVTVGTLLILGVVSMLCGYAVARYRFPGHMLVYVLMICFIAVPTHSLMVPVYTFMKEIGLTNNFYGLMLVYTAFNIPFSVVLMKSHFETIPAEIEEAARIDGCNEFRVFRHVGLPMAKGAIATVTIINITSVWSELMFASVLLMDTKKRTLPIAISLFNTSVYNTSIGVLMAGLT
ncbi:MAG: carbohydrate ABC transporter permease, partial [Oscillospiraceae bacterium]